MGRVARAIIVRGAVAAAMLVAGTGCPGIMAPPARHHALRGPDPVPEDTVEVSATASGHIAHALQPRSPGIAASIGARTGLAKDLGLVVEASTFSMLPSRRLEQPWKAYLFSGRGGVSIHATEALAFEMGLGGGYSVAGSYLAPDGELIVGSTSLDPIQIVYGNSVFVSFPLHAPRVAASEIGSESGTQHFVRETGLPDEADGGFGTGQRFGINVTLSEPSANSVGTTVRFGSGMMLAFDHDRGGEFSDFRIDFWAATGLALEL